MTSLPSVLDVEDALERARSATDEEIGEEIESVRDHLAAVSDPETTDPEGHLDTAENELLAIEERIDDDDDAARDVRAARNRIELYRDARDGREDGLFVLETESRATEDGVPDATEIVATVINERTPRDVQLIVTFYDEDDRALEEVVSPELRLDAGDQRPVEIEASTPADASYYLVDVRGIRDADADADADAAPGEAAEPATPGTTLERARESLAEAEETAPSQIREQLLSIGEGLDELVGGDQTEREPAPHLDRIEELEAKLAGLERETEGTTRNRIEDARDHLLTYRRDHD